MSSDEMVSFRLCGKGGSGENLCFLVHSMQGEEALGDLFEYRVKLMVAPDGTTDSEIDSLRDVALSSFLNQEASLQVPLDPQQGGVREFNGLVTDVRLIDNFAPHPDAKWFYYEVMMRPRMWLLGLSSHCRVFSTMTVLDIAKKILDDASIDHDIRCHDAYPVIELCVQYNETDIDFLDRLLRRDGIYYYFVHRDRKHTVIITDAVGESALCTPNPAKANPVIPYQCEVDESFHPGIYLWNEEERLSTERVELASYDFKSAKTNQDQGLRASMAAEAAGACGCMQLYTPHYKSPDDGERLAKAYLTARQSRSMRAEAEGNIRSVSTGGLFTLDKTIRQSQQAKYLVTRASYTLNACQTSRQLRQMKSESQAVFEKGKGQGEEAADFFEIVEFRRKYQGFTCAFEATPYDRGFRPSMPHSGISGERFDGGYVRHPLLQTATVVGVEDKEVDADAYARIKVRFHWEASDANDDAAKRPGLRLSKPWAGSRFGVHVIPRIGQEVIVAFTDVDEPIIVGCVDNQAHMPPHDPSRFPGVSTIRTQSLTHEDEHSELRFNDDTTQMLLYTTGRYDNRVEKDKLIWVGQNEHRIVKGAQRLQVNEQDLIVDKNQKMKIGGQASLTVDGSLLCEVKGDHAVEGKTVSMHGNTGIVVRSNEEITLQVGANAIKIDEAGIHLQGEVINLNMGGAMPAPPLDSAPDLPTAPDEADSGALDS